MEIVILVLVLILSIFLQLIFYKKNNFKFGNIDVLLFQIAFVIFYQIGQFDYLYSSGINSVNGFQLIFYIFILFNIILTYILKVIKTRSYISANKIGLYFCVMIIDFICLCFAPGFFDFLALVIIHIGVSLILLGSFLLINFILWLLKKIKKVSIDYNYNGKLFSKKINIVIIFFVLVVPILIAVLGRYDFKKQEKRHREKAIKIADLYVGSNYKLNYINKEFSCFMFCNYDDWIGYEMIYESKVDDSKVYLTIDKETFEIIEHNYNN